MKSSFLSIKKFEVPVISFKYIFKNLSNNQIIFTNKILTNNWVLLNINPQKVETYDEIIKLHN